MLDDSHYFTVTDLKQFGYCQRVVFYERCLPHIRPRTYKMDAGRDAHEVETERAVRRTLSVYDILKGERQFDVRLSSDKFHLTGEVDEVVRTDTNEIFPVDYKLARQASNHYKLQLAAYALLMQETEHKTVSRGYLYLIPIRRLVKVEITSALYQQVEAILTQLEAMLAKEQMPSPPANRNFCAACEFRRFCNDI
jgi:CRISPR-associated exonuclease Cas4